MTERPTTGERRASSEDAGPTLPSFALLFVSLLAVYRVALPNDAPLYKAMAERGDDLLLDAGG
jgi:hypothetical protein